MTFRLLPIPIALSAGTRHRYCSRLVWSSRTMSAAHARDTAKPSPTLESLAAEIETIQGRLPDQAHAMADVGYQFSNLWFAGQRENWPLAEFYWKETKSHLNWAVRIIPKPKDSAGREVDLGGDLASSRK